MRTLVEGLLSRLLLSVIGTSNGSLGPPRLAESRLVVGALLYLLGSLCIGDSFCELLHLLGSLGATEYMSAVELVA